MTKDNHYLLFTSELVFTSQGLITYYLVDIFYPQHKVWWIFYFVIARLFIYISKQVRQPLIPYFYQKIKLWLG